MQFLRTCARFLFFVFFFSFLLSLFYLQFFLSYHHYETYMPILTDRSSLFPANFISPFCTTYVQRTLNVFTCSYCLPRSLSLNLSLVLSLPLSPFLYFYLMLSYDIPIILYYTAILLYLYIQPALPGRLKLCTQDAWCTAFWLIPLTTSGSTRCGTSTSPPPRSWSQPSRCFYVVTRPGANALENYTMDQLEPSLRIII